MHHIGNITCRDVFRCGVAVGAHDAGGDVAAAAGRAVLGEAKVGELRVEVLQGAERRVRRRVLVRNCARMDRAVMCAARWGLQCRAERGLSPYRVEEDVRGLEVSVDDVLLRGVQEGQTARRADRDAQPEAPRERLERASAFWLTQKKNCVIFSKSVLVSQRVRELLCRFGQEQFRFVLGIQMTLSFSANS